MNRQNFNKGLFLTAAGSFWWGFFGVMYFKYISFAGHIEVVVHRSLWTTVTLLLTTIFFSKWNIFKKIISNKNELFFLLLSGILIFANWSIWIYAISVDQVINASFGYFIMPILSVFLGFFFFKEKLNSKRILSISLVLLSIVYLIFVDFKSIPWVGIGVALSWGFYNLVRKKISVSTDIGLFIESIFILPFILVVFYFITKNNLNDFAFSNPTLMFILMMAGPMTVIPLFLYVRGVELCGLGPTGMIFYITPTLQFILGYFYYGEEFSIVKFGSFIIIWIAVIIYLSDLYEKN